MAYTILSLSYNSQCIPFPEWILLFTICLAPLTAHIASKTPQVSYLTETRPRWYDHLSHYHPPSILWRYAAITDRRLRAKECNNLDMAATNALFWTAKVWDGSEELVALAAPRCSHSPEFSHVEILSSTMFKTFITALQGIAALYSLVGALAGSSTFMQQMGIDLVFFPLAVLGLLRLCAAAWLTEDFAYTIRNDLTMKPLRRAGTLAENSVDDLNPLIPTKSAALRFRSTSYWLSWVFRVVCLLLLLGIWIISLLYVAPTTHNELAEGVCTTTSFLAAVS